MSSPTVIRDQAAKPAGLLPKNVQSWLLIGLATLMVLIMWLTGGKKPPAARPGSPPAPSVEAPLEVNEARIVELQNRILALQHKQIAAQNALSQQSRTLATPEPESDPARTAAAAPPERAEDLIAAERKKREYLALFASNVALTYRKSQMPGTSREADSAASLERDFQAAQLAESPLPPPTGNVRPSGDAASESDRKEGTRNPVAGPAGAPAAAIGKTYVLFEGTVLETVLVNRLDGQTRGPIECLLTTDVYSHDRQHLLIPAGTKLVGETRKVETLGQSRLAVSFHRLIMPDGYTTSLDHFEGLDQIGDAGLRDQVNNHYLRIFGASLAVGAIGAAAAGGTSGALTAPGSDLLRQGFAQGTAQSSAEILDRFLNIPPTVTIREGHRVKVYLSGDLALPDYANHIMPRNL
jgi:type IV secretion system protein VirB10